ncbi:MAG: hypothetical protein O9256_00725 [Rhizobiaceae bacterium]|nr:hypothetical protein [Rhizobiaceae bacterium]
MTFFRNSGRAAFLLFVVLLAGGVHASDTSDSTDALLKQLEELNQRIGSNADWLSEAAERSQQIADGQNPEILPDEELIQSPLPMIEAPPGSDPVLVMTARLTAYANRNIEIANRYQRDLTALSIHTLLHPSSYVTEEALASMPKRMAMLDRAYRRMVRDARESTRAFAAQMRSGDLPRDAIAGFNASFNDGRQMEEQIAMEGRVMIQMATMVAFLIEARPNTDGDLFLFERDEDVVTFNQHFASLNELVEEQTAMMRAQQEKISDAAETIKSVQ